MTIGERIKKRRETLGISTEELARRIGKSRANIYRYENDEIENMSVTVIEPIAKALYTSPAYIMGWEDDPDTKPQQLIIPEEYKDLQVAFYEGAKDLKQEDIDEVVKFMEFLKSKKK